jgi:hypothetical protein
MNEYYLKLNSNSKLKDTLIEFAKKPTTKWIRKNAFDIAIVPQSLIVNDPVVQEISKRFNSTPIIFKLMPWQFYRFHTDAARSCALNMFLDGEDSQTYFGESTDDEEVTSITEIVYEKNYFYLLNTHMKHAVINRNNIRYMFSMGFDTSVDYSVVKKFCCESNL